MNDELTLFVYWQDPDTRRWHVVGRLTHSQELFRFVYTQGALASPRFVPFGRMTGLQDEYQSRELFPLFSNRLLPKSRPEYRDFLNWLAMDNGNADPLMLLGRSGGLRGTDTLAMYPMPVPEGDNSYRVTFFCHGMRYMGKSFGETVSVLQTYETLYPMYDMQNPSDKNALALRTNDPATMIGYCPRFFAKDFRSLLEACPKEARISVLRINHGAPIEFRLLCEFKSPWPKGFSACSDVEYKSLAKKHPSRPPNKKKTKQRKTKSRNKTRKKSATRR